MKKCIKKTLLTVAFILSGGYSQAQNNRFIPAATIQCPEKTSCGHMIIASARIDRGNLPENLLAVKYQWTVLVNGQANHDFLVWPDGSQIVFSASDAPSNTTIILDIDCLTGTETQADKDKKLYSDVQLVSPELAVKTIAVGSGEPVPTPTPNPLPGPTPPPSPPAPTIPAGKYGLGKFAFDTLIADQTLSKTDKFKLAKALSDSFGKVASDVQNNATSGSLDAVLARTKAQNNVAIANAGIAGDTTSYKKAISGFVYDIIYTKNAVQNLTDLAAAWNELAQGLAAAAQYLSSSAISNQGE